MNSESILENLSFESLGYRKIEQDIFRVIAELGSSNSWWVEGRDLDQNTAYVLATCITNPIEAEGMAQGFRDTIREGADLSYEEDQSRVARLKVSVMSPDIASGA